MRRMRSSGDIFWQPTGEGNQKTFIASLNFRGIGILNASFERIRKCDVCIVRTYQGPQQNSRKRPPARQRYPGTTIVQCTSLPAMVRLSGFCFAFRERATHFAGTTSERKSTLHLKKTCVLPALLWGRQKKSTTPYSAKRARRARGRNTHPERATAPYARNDTPCSRTGAPSA